MVGGTPTQVWQPLGNAGKYREEHRLDGGGEQVNDDTTWGVLMTMMGLAALGDGGTNTDKTSNKWELPARDSDQKLRTSMHCQ